MRSGSRVLDRSLLDLLDQRQVAYCVIGGVALAAHGHARYTADVDLLTMDRRVLDVEFWAGAPRAVELRTGDADDPLAGLVRWPASPPHDLVVGRGHAMSVAVAPAAHDTLLDAPVASLEAMVLLKLEAGGPQDLNDILSLADAVRVLGGQVHWHATIGPHLERLSAPARLAWQRVAGDLPR
jgi:hypothetical protein